MTRRRTPISIYDYPEHLNPFRDDVDEGEDIKYHTTGRRRSSFRVNAWSVFAGRGKSPERSTPSPVASRFLTWTPKLLRRASFRRTITPTTQAPPPPPEHKNALFPPPRTSPARPPFPTHINNSTPNSSPAPVPAVRTRRLAQRAGGEDETKYIQQGAKPKKKRRAPAPPTPQPGRASQPQEPEPSCSAAQEQPQPSGEQKSATTATSAECYVEQSRVSPVEPEETSVIASETTAEVQLEMTQSSNSSAASEESAGGGQGVTSQEVPGQLIKNELAPVAAEETAELVSQDLTVEQNTSQTLSTGSSVPADESVETVTIQNEVITAEQSGGDIDQRSTPEPIIQETTSESIIQETTSESIIQETTSESIIQETTSGSIIQETEIVHRDGSDTAENTENEILSANEVELPLQGSTEMENTREIEEYVSASSTEENSVIMENRIEESPLRIKESESSNSLNDMKKEHVYTEEEESGGNKSLANAPLENGFGGSDSEISPSKTHLIDEESKPSPKPRTILPEKPTEQDKKP